MNFKILRFVPYKDIADGKCNILIGGKGRLGIQSQLHALSGGQNKQRVTGGEALGVTLLTPPTCAEKAGKKSEDNPQITVNVPTLDNCHICLKGMPCRPLQMWESPRPRPHARHRSDSGHEVAQLKSRPQHLRSAQRRHGSGWQTIR